MFSSIVRLNFLWCVTSLCLLVVTIAKVSTFGSLDFFVRGKWRTHLSVGQFFQAFCHSLSFNPLHGGFGGRRGALPPALHVMLVAGRSSSRYSSQWKKDASPKVTSPPRGSSHSITGRVWIKGWASLWQDGTTLRGYSSSRAMQGIGWGPCGNCISVQFLLLPNHASFTSPQLVLRAFSNKISMWYSFSESASRGTWSKKVTLSTRMQIVPYILKCLVFISLTSPRHPVALCCLMASPSLLPIAFLWMIDGMHFMWGTLSVPLLGNF